MTGKEILKKVEKFNELAETFGKEKVKAVFVSDYCPELGSDSCTAEFDNYKDFYNFIDDEYIADFRTLIVEDEWTEKESGCYTYNLKVGRTYESIKLYVK